MDATEIQNWSQALNRSGKDFPMINSFKGLIGHPLAAAGSIELVACALQIKHQKIYGNCNINPLKPEIEKIIDSDRAPEKSISHKIDYLMKASFGFGDVNACVVLKRFT
jgi:3-oxoacyl-(acyl-carrier-protein) synthase